MIETEVAIYAKLNTVPSFIPVKKEQHVQYESKAVTMKGSSTLRVRETTTEDSVSYVLTFKQKLNQNNGSNTELNFPSNKEIFDNYKPFAERIIKKTRYTYCVKDPVLTLINQQTNQREVHKLEQLLIELDIYPGTDWVKIDIELDDALKQLPDNTYTLVFNRNFFIFDIKEYYLSTEPTHKEKIGSIYEEILKGIKESE